MRLRLSATFLASSIIAMLVIAHPTGAYAESLQKFLQDKIWINTGFASHLGPGGGADCLVPDRNDRARTGFCLHTFKLEANGVISSTCGEDADTISYKAKWSLLNEDEQDVIKIETTKNAFYYRIYWGKKSNYFKMVTINSNRNETRCEMDFELKK